MGFAKRYSACALAVCLWSTAAQPADRCVTCHSRLPDARLRAPAEQVKDSAHGDEQLGCAACHGGDREDPTVRAHAPADFKPRPTRADIPTLCGGCHADARFVRRFNASLAIDQLALYETSVHGQRFKDGDTAVATCTSCHGVHDIVPVADPRSRVHPTRLASTCAACHSDQKLMEPYKIPTDQHDKWSSSVHGTAIEKGNLAAPTCSSCHGSHGATPPAVNSVARVCGRCHQDQLERFRASPHARPFARLGFPECEQCHSNHAVLRTSEALVGLGPDTMCGKCHAEGQKASAVVQELSAVIKRAHEQGDRARQEVDEAALSGLRTSAARLALRDVHTAELRLANVLHSFDAKKLHEAADVVDEAAARATKHVRDAEDERTRRKRGYMVVASLLLIHLLLVLLKIRRTSMPLKEEA